MPNYISRRIDHIIDNDINGIQYQTLYLTTDDGQLGCVWSLKSKHIFSIGDTVELKLIAKKGKLTVGVVYP